MSAREAQIAAALERDAYLASVDAMDPEELAAAYNAAWEAVRCAMAQAEPVLRTMLARAVREHEPNATSISIEPTDQGGPGWVYGGTNDAIHDDDTISSLLRDLGEFMSSEAHSAHYFDLTRRA